MPPMPAIPPWELVQPLLLHAMLPAFIAAALVTLIVRLICGARQATLAGALGVVVGVGLGLWMHTAFAPGEEEFSWGRTFAEAGDLLLEALRLANGESTWNRMLWAALAALWVGRVARMPNVPLMAGWFLRAAASFGVAWFVIAPTTRSETEIGRAHV